MIYTVIGLNKQSTLQMKPLIVLYICSDEYKYRNSRANVAILYNFSPPKKIYSNVKNVKTLCFDAIQHQRPPTTSEKV